MNLSTESGIYCSLGQVTLKCSLYVVSHLVYVEGDAIGHKADAIGKKRLYS